MIDCHLEEFQYTRDEHDEDSDGPYEKTEYYKSEQYVKNTYGKDGTAVKYMREIADNKWSVDKFFSQLELAKPQNGYDKLITDLIYKSSKLLYSNITLFNTIDHSLDPEEDNGNTSFLLAWDYDYLLDQKTTSLAEQGDITHLSLTSSASSKDRIFIDNNYLLISFYYNIIYFYKKWNSYTDKLKQKQS